MTQRIQIVSGPFTGHTGIISEEPNRAHPDLWIVLLDAYPNQPAQFTSDRFVYADAPAPVLVEEERLPFTEEPPDDEDQDDPPLFDEDEDSLPVPAARKPKGRKRS